MIHQCLLRERLFKLSAICVTLPCFSFSACAQVLGTGDPINPPIGRLIFGLIFCIFLAVGIIVFLKKYKTPLRSRFSQTLFRRENGLSEDVIFVRQTTRVGPHADVCLIEYGAKEFLVLMSQNQFLVLSEKTNTIAENSSKDGAL